MIEARIISKADEDICLILNFDNHRGNYVCECGTASGLTTKDCLESKAFFISHTHIDHFINFDTFIRHLIGGPFHVIICGPEGIAENLRAKLLGYNWNLIRANSKGAMVFEVREFVDEQHYSKYSITSPEWELGEPEVCESPVIYQNEKFSVKALNLDHRIPSIAFRFQEHDQVKMNMDKSPYKPGKWVSQLKEAFIADDKDVLLHVDDRTKKAGSLFGLLEMKKGETLGIVMDHAGIPANHQKIADFFYEVDQLFIESFYLHEESEIALANFHSTASLSGQAAFQAKVKKATPVHFSRKYDEEERALLEKEFYEAFQGTSG